MSFLRDSLLIYRRQMRMSLRMPQWLLFALVQPVMYLVLFGPMLETVAKNPSFPPGDTWRVFVPGILVQLGIFGTLFAGFGLLEELRSGVIDRLRVTPLSRAALLFGHVLRDATVLIVQAIVLIAVSIPFGLRLTWQAAVFGPLVVLLLAIAFASLSYGVAMLTKEEDPLIGLLNLIGPPLLLLSGILLPLSFAPTWEQRLGDLNPISHVVTGLRALFRGDLASHEVLWGFVAAGLTAVVTVWFGTRTFQKENA